MTGWRSTGRGGVQVEGQPSLEFLRSSCGHEITRPIGRQMPMRRPHRHASGPARLPNRAVHLLRWLWRHSERIGRQLEGDQRAASATSASPRDTNGTPKGSEKQTHAHWLDKKFSPRSLARQLRADLALARIAARPKSGRED